MMLPPELCTGCSACAAVCPKNAVTMTENSEGFPEPDVDAEKCINCGLCEKTCPVIQPPLLTGDCNYSKCGIYAAYYKNDEVRKNSSSGGLFTLLAEYILNNNGVVFGAAFDETFEVKHIAVEKIEDLDKVRRSKYVQSDIGNTFREVKEFLKTGRQVLFTGTPCQVAGLKSFLGKSGKDLTLTNPALLTAVDIICHGVPSPAVWRAYIRETEQRYGSQLAEVNFRDKPSGWNACLMLMLSLRSGAKYSSPLYEDAFGGAFLQNLCLRPSCHHCPANDFQSGSDITLGDYWGIDTAHPGFNDSKGTSLSIIKTEHGKTLWNRITADELVRCLPSTLEKALKGNPAIKHSAQPHPQRQFFFNEFVLTTSSSGSKDGNTVIPLFEKYLGRYDVGILNFQFDGNFNYGASFVAYSLQRTVEKLGYRPFHINLSFAGTFEGSEDNPFKRFSDRFIRRTGLCQTKDDLREYIDGRFRYLISGGDQVFRWHDNFNFLFDWASGKKTLISYSASFGFDSLSKIEFYKGKKKYAAECFRRFDALSVREASGAKILQDEFGLNAAVVLDPVLLLDAEAYQEIIDAEEQLTGGVYQSPADYIAFYTISDSLGGKLHHHRQHLPNLKYRFIDMFRSENGQYRSFGQWLNIIKNAKYVITDSFHAAVFSILYRKQFLAVGRQFGGNDRILTLLDTLGIDRKRFIIDLQEIDEALFSESVDYDAVFEKLQRERNRSTEWLKQALAVEPHQIEILYRKPLWYRLYRKVRGLAGKIKRLILRR